MGKDAVAVVLVVDRSLALVHPVRSMNDPDHLWDRYVWRSDIVAQLRQKTGTSVKTVVTYQEEARLSSFDEAGVEIPHLAFGANLHHALMTARDVCEDTGTSQIVVVTYSFPTAHTVDNRDVYFNLHPVPEALDAARGAAQQCAAEAIRIDVLLYRNDTDEDRDLESYYLDIVSGSGGAVIPVRACDEALAVDQWIRSADTVA